MIKPQELRIGNWVYGYQMDLQIIATDFVKKEPFWKVITPIPLTEQWLEKFGFDESLHIQINLQDYFLESGFEENQYVLRLPYAPNFSKFIATVKYVHQLQNLYFALTGQELTIKESISSL